MNSRDGRGGASSDSKDLFGPVPRVAARSPYTLRQKLRMSFWWLVEVLLFRTSPHRMNGFRCSLLRAFGAEVGANTFIHAHAKIWFPWNLRIGANAGIGFDALIYNLDRVEIGDYATISHYVQINTGSHDYRDPAFPLVTRPVRVGSGAFVGSDCYIGWGVTIGKMAVIGARSVVLDDMPAYHVCAGHRCVPLRPYEVREDG